ncbi:MAG TPA: hypothetical protein VI037_05240 [Nitrososphaera sp.]
MKRGHIVLISGAVLLVVGIIISAIWAVQFAGSFLRDNTIVAQTSIDAGKSVDSRIDVNQLDRPVSLAIGIDRSGQIQQQQQPQIPPSSSSSSSSNVRLKEVVTDPNGRVVSSNEFGDSFFTSFKPEVAGVYTVTVTNLGTNPVTVSGAFGYMPFNALGGKPNIDSMLGSGGLGMIIAGGIFAAAGVVTLIVGAIITVIDSRRQSPTTTSEGGISYRKD